jgi:DNA-binding NarL/FixJ family response regulator
MRLGYDFYPHIIHKDDLRLLARMHSAVLNSPYIAKCPENIAHFSFTVRIKIYPDITEETEYQMVYHKLKPVFFNGKLCFGICMMNISVLQTSGNLRVYFKDNIDSFDAYSFVSQRWDTEQVEHLTDREILILKFAKQGLNNKVIAGKLNIKYETLRRINTSICRKFNLETIEQVIVYATNHRMLFDTRRTYDTTKKRKGKKHCPKLKLTPKKLEHAQEYLDNGQSIRSIAKEIGVSEGGIRKAIKSGKLYKKQQ